MSDESSKVVTVAKRKPPAAGMGRKKGVPNKSTRAVKDAIAYAAEELGGADGLVRWAQADPQNLRIFWGTIYPKLLPLQVSGEGGGAIVVRWEK
jgi:hypothetical protein